MTKKYEVHTEQRNNGAVKIIITDPRNDKWAKISVSKSTALAAGSSTEMFERAKAVAREYEVDVSKGVPVDQAINKILDAYN